jgi:hypothetical protein
MVTSFRTRLAPNVCVVFCIDIIIIVVRERIPLPNDNKHVLSFKKVYDRLFKDFKDKLVQEYALMKNSY